MSKKLNAVKLSSLGSVLLLFIASCSTPSLEDVKTKDEYIKRISALSENELQKTLKTDLDSLNSLKEEIDGFNIYIGFGMSMGNGSGKKDELKSDSVFKINTDFNGIRKGVAEYTQNLIFTQKPELPYSSFEVYPNGESANVSKDDLSISLKKLYVKGQAYPEDKIGMKRVDSMTVDFSYEYPKSVKTFKFNPKDKKAIRYQNKAISIYSAEGEELEFDVPLSLYSDILAYQALNADGVLMNSNSSSAIPLTTINPGIKKDFAEALVVLKAASKMTDKDAIVKELGKIPAELFPKIAQYRSFNAKLAALDKNEHLKGFEAIKQMKEIIAGDKELFGLEMQRISLKFPDQVRELVLYLAEDREKITGSAVALANAYSTSYGTYLDRKADKYGIVDSNFNIVIPASEPDLAATDNTGHYYKSSKADQVFHLDAKNRKLIPIKKGYSFIKDLSDKMTVFMDSNKYVGVLENDEKEVIPFEYDEIEKVGNVLLLTKSKRGRKKREIRSLDNKLITELKGLSTKSYPEYGVIIIEDELEKLGMIDKNGKMVVKPIYNELVPVDQQPLLVYADDSQRYLSGILKGDGTKLTPPIFGHIDDFKDGMAVYRPAQEEAGKSYGYLNKAGQPVLSKYTVAYGFEAGYALVFDNDVFSIIDTSGKKVRQIPYKVLGDPTISLSGKQTIYEIDGKKYNYIGQPIN
ncbi:WG repeat-containing protein [Pedobacter sp. MC2016-14]|uniref:WG repeat-containing protein n=1 Tax=Pedobacter sp. MC2016-14 TaxID=2897327 RepID=UPI001E5C0344|nr:WG repeat-containing protein [Pedobacter sp. MC2016-14]MCD0489910.1 WG repeat-containing protein [Pedobacter sp. MC2016-14]